MLFTGRCQSVRSSVFTERYQLLTIMADLHCLQFRKECGINLPAAVFDFLRKAHGR